MISMKADYQFPGVLDHEKEQVILYTETWDSLEKKNVG